ncbi:hypothetical protein [Rhizobium sp. C1]|uniref:hypothetical protein n=1 Tax=Rhizobium sp. C1 TaxID=1349799 RepID=UPI001E6205DD|nr:hypothetical protein [Rhizobium sp. C1]MCD2178235.1 hypothetical protein [Rhizobium sp. C1]
MKSLISIFRATEENLSSFPVSALKPKRRETATCTCHRDGAAGLCVCDAVSAGDPIDPATR